MKDKRPQTKTARQSVISHILSNQYVNSQKQLRRLLAEEGVVTTQSTLSRDLEELNARKEKHEDGVSYYVLRSTGSNPAPAVFVPENASRERLKKTCQELLVTAQTKDDFIIARTLAGGGQLIGSFIDNANFPEVMGTIAGDDTILIICTHRDKALSLCSFLLEIAEAKS